jgi:hypothetical protein
MSDDFQIKPLSTGIGLGSLQAPKIRRPPQDAKQQQIKPQIETIPVTSSLGLATKKSNPLVPQNQLLPKSHSPVPAVPSVLSSEPIVDSLPSLGTMNPAQNTTGYAVYRSQSHGSKLKSQRSTKGIVLLAQWLVGFGLDGIMVFMTLMLGSVIATMAWRLGNGVDQALDPFAAIVSMAQALQSYGAKLVVSAMMATLILYVGTTKIIFGGTLGHLFRR